MIALINSFLSILLSKKTMNFLIGNIIVSCLLFLYFSNSFMDADEMRLNQGQLKLNYIVEAVTYIKINIVIIGVYFVMLSNRIFMIEHMFLNLYERKTFMLSILLTMFGLMVLMISIIFSLFVIIGGYLTTFMDGSNYILIFTQIVLFGLYYLIVSLLVFRIIKSVYSMVGVILFYLVASTFTPYLVEASEYTWFEEVLNLFVNDLLISPTLEVSFVHGIIYVTSLILALMTVVLYRHNKTDLL